MEITDSVLTSLFVGLVLVMIQVVKFFINKYGKRNEETSHSKIKEVFEKVAQIKESCFLTKEQVDKLNDLHEMMKKMEEMHNVFNENHVPAWYVPSELLVLVRESNNCLDGLEKSIDISIEETKAGQAVIINRMSDLITSQKLMTERLGDLIAALNKFSR